MQRSKFRDRNYNPKTTGLEKAGFEPARLATAVLKTATLTTRLSIETEIRVRQKENLAGVTNSSLHLCKDRPEKKIMYLVLQGRHNFSISISACLEARRFSVDDGTVLAQFFALQGEH